VRLTCQEGLVPGADLLAKWAFLEAAGWDGLELTGGADFPGRAAELRAAGVPVRTVCIAGGPFIGEFDAERRAEAVTVMKGLLSGIAEAGGTGAITPAAYARFSRVLPPYTPPRGPEEDRAVMLEALAELGEHAAREGVVVYLEPLNRYEDHIVNTLAQAVELAEATGSDCVRVMGDLYHMNIEEADPVGALRAAGPRLAHVHLSDSNRGQPFAGHVDWPAVLAALAEAGYAGDLALECRLRGDAETVLPDVARRLRGRTGSP
jgi:sugar phosphate isomerase/epimerase